MMAKIKNIKAMITFWEWMGPYSYFPEFMNIKPNIQKIKNTKLKIPPPPNNTNKANAEIIPVPFDIKYIIAITMNIDATALIHNPQLRNLKPFSVFVSKRNPGGGKYGDGMYPWEIFERKFGATCLGEPFNVLISPSSSVFAYDIL